MLNRLGLTGRGAEIGVAEGRFSECIMRDWFGREILLVDPYQWQSSKRDVSDKDQQQHDYNYGQAVWRMLRFRGRVKHIVEKSVDAAAKVPDGSLDFVYIDAKHDYRSVMADMTAWYPKVKKGGIFAGHDYKNSCVRNNLVEVKRAVDNFFVHQNPINPIKVSTTTEDNLPSWYMVKL